MKAISEILSVFVECAAAAGGGLLLDLDDLPDPREMGEHAPLRVTRSVHFTRMPDLTAPLTIGNCYSFA